MLHLRSPAYYSKKLLGRARRHLQQFGAERTSIADDFAYPHFCARAATDEHVFRNFKVDPIYNRVLEHVTHEEGKKYLEHILIQSPDLVEHFDRFRENDRFGNPRTFDYGRYGVFSPTTLRYISVLGDLVMNFGDLDHLKIIEVGVGYGGQCKVISDRYEFASYTMVDLEPVLRLSERYLGKLGVKNVRFSSADALDERGDYDLVISNYAFTECTRSVQEHYIRRVLSRSGRGFMVCNQITPGRFRSYSRAELLNVIPGSTVVDEVPLTYETNFVMLWDRHVSR
jgi:putative sugar O-methyltransferase